MEATEPCNPSTLRLEKAIIDKNKCDQGAAIFYAMPPLNIEYCQANLTDTLVTSLPTTIGVLSSYPYRFWPPNGLQAILSNTNQATITIALTDYWSNALIAKGVCNEYRLCANAAVIDPSINRKPIQCDPMSGLYTVQTEPIAPGPYPVPIGQTASVCEEEQAPLLPLPDYTFSFRFLAGTYHLFQTTQASAKKFELIIIFFLYIGRTFIVSNSSTATSNCTTQLCSFEYVLSIVEDLDTVLLRPGLYQLTFAPRITKSITIAQFTTNEVTTLDFSLIPGSGIVIESTSGNVTIIGLVLTKYQGHQSVPPSLLTSDVIPQPTSA